MNKKPKRPDLLLNTFNDVTDKGRITIDKICQTAAKLFSEKGYTQSTMADISHESGMSKGGIYHFFSTKEEILFAILNRFMDEILYQLKEKLQTITDPCERIHTIIHHDIHYSCKNWCETRVMLHEEHNLPSTYLQIIRKKEKEYVRIVRSAVGNLIHSKKNDLQKINLVTYLLLGMINWNYKWYNPMGKVKPTHLADSIYDLFLGNSPTRNV